MVSAGLPRLQTLKYYFPKSENKALNSDRSGETKDILDRLQTRNRNVELGMEVGGMKMERIKKLVIDFDAYTSRQLDDLKVLVEELVEMNAENQLWEVEI